MTHVSAHDRSLRNTHDASNVVHREIRPDPNRNENTASHTEVHTQKYTLVYKQQSLGVLM